MTLISRFSGSKILVTLLTAESQRQYFRMQGLDYPVHRTINEIIERDSAGQFQVRSPHDALRMVQTTPRRAVIYDGRAVPLFSDHK